MDAVEASKDSWIKKAEDAFDIVTELSLDLEECVSPEEAHEIFKSNEALKDEISKFVLATINWHCLSRFYIIQPGLTLNFRNSNQTSLCSVSDISRDLRERFESQ